MTDAVTDTHSLVWYLQDSPKLGKEANRIFEACDRGEAVIYVSTICLVEIVYLQEKGRIPTHLTRELQRQLRSSTNHLILADLTEEIVDALARVPREHVPDMPDRIIAATALHLDLPLISRDRQIQTAEINTVW